MRPWAASLFLGLALAIGGAVGPSSDGFAAAKKDDGDKKKLSLRERFALPSHVQMRPMMVPIHHPYQSVSAITMFLEADVRKEVGAICRKVPRIRDAVLGVLSREPIPTYRGRLVLNGVAERIIAPINVSLGTTKIRSIHIEPGLVRVSGNSGISRLPFATINGCKGIKEIELEILKEEQKRRLNSQNEGMASSSPPRGRLLAMAGRRVR